MLATAIFAGGKLLSDRKQQQSKTSTTNNKINPDENEERILDQKLAASLCGMKMDANPRHLRLTKALSKNDTVDTKASQEAFIEFRRMARDLTDIIALASSPPSSSYFTEQLFDPARQIRIFTRTFSTFPVDMVKAVFYVPCAPKDFLSLLDFENRKTWDENFVAGEVLYEEGEKNRDDFTIKKMRFDAFPNLVMARDFELGVHTKVDPVNGYAYVKAISTPYEFGSSVNTNSVVRGYIPMSGFVVRPCHVNEKVSKEIFDHQNEREGIVSSSNRGISSLIQMSSSLKAKHSSFAAANAAAANRNESASSSIFSSVKKWSQKAMGNNNSKNNGKDASSSSSVTSTGENDEKGMYHQQQSSTTTPKLFPPVTTHCEVTYVALVHPRGSIPVMLLNLIIGKQTASMKVLQNAAMKMSLAANMNGGTVKKTASDFDALLLQSKL